MGFAKYHEDIISCQNGTSRVRAEIKQAVQDRVPSKKPAPKKTGEKTMSKLKEFTASTARPLPVVVLADVSGSMCTNGKIDALNDAVQEMLESFGGEGDTRAEIHVSVVTFGKEGAKLHQPLAPASKVQWARMAAADGADGRSLRRRDRHDRGSRAGPEPRVSPDDHPGLRRTAHQ